MPNYPFAFLKNLEALKEVQELFDCCPKEFKKQLYISKRPNYKQLYQKLFMLAERVMQNSERDRHLPGLVITSNFLPIEASVWLKDTDRKHTIVSFGYLSDICQKNKYSKEKEETLLGAIIFHDVFTRKEFKTQESREEHMKKGAESFKDMCIQETYLRQKRDVLIEELSQKQFEDIEHIIQNHDKPNIKKPFDSNKIELLLPHRAADLLWRVDFRGFALDLARIILEENGKYEPKSFFVKVLKSHNAEANLYNQDRGFKEFLRLKVPYADSASFELFQEAADRIMKDYDISEEKLKEELVGL